jgi:hypothetical protein
LTDKRRFVLGIVIRVDRVVMSKFRQEFRAAISKCQ